MSPLQLNKEETKVLFLIYAAHVDYIYTQEEKDFIQSRTDKDTYDKMYALFLEKGDFAILQMILAHTKEFYNTNESQNELYDLLKEAFKADGNFKRIEKVFIIFFKRMSQL